MNRYSIVVAILTAVLIALGLNVGVTVSNSNAIHAQQFKLHQQIQVVCAEHQTIARIAKEEAEESAASNRNLLPRANIPGISHEELVKSTEKKQEAQIRHAAEYAIIERETC